MIHGLIGVSIAGIMSRQVLELLQQPDAPNLYWALTMLPRPLIDIRGGVEAEMNAVYLSFPEIRDLDDTIVPFFKTNPLKTSKREDFKKFVLVIELMKEKKHLTFDGLKAIAKIAQGMNSQRKSKFLLSSETVRQTLHGE